MNEESSKQLRRFKSEWDLDVEDDALWSVLLDVSRVLDKKITEQINDYKQLHDLKITAVQKQQFRKYLLGLSSWNATDLEPISRPDVAEEDKLSALALISLGLGRSADMLMGTIRSRLESTLVEAEPSTKYSAIVEAKEFGKSHLGIFEIDGELSSDYKVICHNLADFYDSLANYHYAVLVFRNSDWQTITEVALFAESFRVEKNFKLYERTKAAKRQELLTFIEQNQNIKYSEGLHAAVSEFYENLVYGFTFQDLIISESDQTKILVLQKIQLDESVLPCPDCLETIVRGNSYPRLLQKSYECHNPNCPSRSKIGRGKRFDFFNVKRNLKLRSAGVDDLVDIGVRKKFRRDVIENSANLIDSLIQIYSWKLDRVCIVSLGSKESSRNVSGREVHFRDFSKGSDLYRASPLKKLLQNVVNAAHIQSDSPQSKYAEEAFSLYQGDSTRILDALPETIGNAVTSPPYYNAREYSQWPTLVCYLIDMALSAKAIFDKLSTGGKYFYNIGDIVGQDNVYVSSHMSNRRLMLGFYSVLIFELAGFDLLGNIIWDKGEVQSKRNSTDNPYPTFVKPINCYEHIWIFGKDAQPIDVRQEVERIDPVRKINSKGENILGHTAPYPEDLVNLVISYLPRQSSYILDPFVGSGTTVIASAKLGYKGVGIEYDATYYKLALERILLNLRSYKTENGG